MQLVGQILVWVLAAGIIAIGAFYLLRNEPFARGFGLPRPPHQEARGWWQVKGVRDIVSGLVAIVVFFAQPAALPWVILAEALIPVGDMIIVLGNRGSRVRALAVHGATAAAMVVTAALLWG